MERSVFVAKTWSRRLIALEPFKLKLGAGGGDMIEQFITYI